MDSHEISSLQYLNLENHNTRLLVSTSWDSSLQIFDEELSEASHLLRIAAGGHGREDICVMTVSLDLGLIATGSCVGVIAVKYSWLLQITLYRYGISNHVKLKVT